jgi:hypothetical protein
MNKMAVLDLIEHLRYDTRIIVYSKNLEFKNMSDAFKYILDFRTFDYFENDLKEQEEEIINNSEVAYFEVSSNGIIVYI